MKFRETFIKKNFFYQGRAVAFRVDAVRLPNGKHATREYLDHPGAVGVIAITRKGTIVMVRQYRHPVKEVTWEIPAGKLDKRENPLLCAKRELKEETGYTAKRYKKVLAFWPTAAFANEVIHLYVATGLTKGDQNTDEDEFLNVFELRLDEALKAIRSGKIRDSKTIIALFLTKLFLKPK